MEHKKFAKTACLGLVLVLGMNSLMGCGGKTVDYKVDNETESGQEGSNGGKRGLKQFADAPSWQDEWTAVNTKGNEVALSVDAEILVPQADQMYVVEMEEPAFDGAFKEKVAKRIFDGEEIYYNDLEHLPKKDIEKLRERTLEWMDERAGDAEAVKRLEAELSDYDELLETAKDSYTLADTYDVDEYLLEHEGISYALEFDTVGGTFYVEDITCQAKSIRLYPKDYSEVSPEEGMSIYSSLDVNTNVENQCGLSEQEAQELAQRFVDKLDLGYSVFCYSKPLFWMNGEVSGENSNYMANGYIFHYDAGVDQVSFTLFGSQEQYMNYGKKKGEKGERYSLESTLEVYVTDKGVIRMYAVSPVEITGISGGTGLLPLSEIEGIIKEQINEHFGNFRFDYTADDRKVPFNKMELIYFRIRDRENQGHYSYVPAWRLSEMWEREYDLSQYYNFYIRNVVLINAIDGSVIDFYDEV